MSSGVLPRASAQRWIQLESGKAAHHPVGVVLPRNAEPPSGTSRRAWARSLLLMHANPNHGRSCHLSCSATPPATANGEGFCLMRLVMERTTNALLPWSGVTSRGPGRVICQGARRPRWWNLLAGLAGRADGPPRTARRGLVSFLRVDDERSRRRFREAAPGEHQAVDARRPPALARSAVAPIARALYTRAR